MKIDDPSQLVNGAMYVAVGSEMGGHFQHRDYGLTKLKPDRGKKRYPFQWRKLSDEYDGNGGGRNFHWWRGYVCGWEFSVDPRGKAPAGDLGKSPRS